MGMYICNDRAVLLEKKHRRRREDRKTVMIIEVMRQVKVK